MNLVPPQVVMLSVWRNDAERQLVERATHLLEKAHDYPNVRFIWVVGDSSDATEAVLRAMASTRLHDVTVLRHDTHLDAEDGASRHRRLSMTYSAGLRQVRAGDVYVCIHESDIVSPPDLLRRFVAHAAAGRCPIAGWPTLQLADRKVFYDIWGYRAGGRLFTNDPPYHAVYQPRVPFKVDSFGTCYMVHAEDIRAGVTMERRGAVELCDKLRARGRTLWVDPALEVVQPAALWQPSEVVL